MDWFSMYDTYYKYKLWENAWYKKIDSFVKKSIVKRVKSSTKIIKSFTRITMKKLKSSTKIKIKKTKFSQNYYTRWKVPPRLL